MSDPTPPLTLFEALVYGVIQGVTEFLPVSSSGHLAIAHLLGLGSLPAELEAPFDVLLHGATLIAIIAAFWRDILQALRPNGRLWLAIAIAVVPTGLCGLLLKDLYLSAGDHWGVLAVTYCITAGLLLFSEKRSTMQLHQTEAITDSTKPETTKPDLNTVTIRSAIWVGALQILSPLPGISRSGSTIAGGLLGGLTPATAVSFSFIVGLPLIAAATAKDAIDGGFAALVEVTGWMPLIVAFLSSCISGFIAIALLKLVAGRRRLHWFAWYCLIVAGLCLGLAIWA
jgi:undecaprenyl-diphosphatase